MYARVATVQVQVAKLDEAIGIYRDAVVSALREQPGFVGVELLVNHETGSGISITRWASAADERASEASGFYRAQIAKFHGLFAVAPVRETYEVSVFA